MTLHPQYITDTKGNKQAVVLPIKEYNLLLEELEDINKLYDDGKKIVPQWQKDKVNLRLKDLEKHPEKAIDFDKALNGIEKKYGL